MICWFFRSSAHPLYPRPPPPPPSPTHNLSANRHGWIQIRRTVALCTVSTTCIRMFHIRCLEQQGNVGLEEIVDDLDVSTRTNRRSELLRQGPKSNPCRQHFFVTGVTALHHCAVRQYVTAARQAESYPATSQSVEADMAEVGRRSRTPHAILCNLWYYVRLPI